MYRINVALTVGLLILFLGGCVTTSGARRNDGAPLEISQTVEVDGLSSLEIYTEAKIWFHRAFKHPVAVIDLDERELRIIVGQGNFPIELTKSGNLGGDYPFAGSVEFRMRFEARDGRYRIAFTDLIHSSDDLGGSFRNLSDATKPGACVPTCDADKDWSAREWSELKAKATSTLEDLAASLYRAESEKAADNDW